MSESIDSQPDQDADVAVANWPTPSARTLDPGVPRLLHAAILQGLKSTRELLATGPSSMVIVSDCGDSRGAAKVIGTAATAFGKSLARENARDPLRVNVIADDLTDPQNIRLLRFLAGDGASFVTGQAFGPRCLPIAAPAPVPDWELASGSWILVSGGAGAIGEAIVRRLHGAGHRILIGHVRSEPAIRLARDVDPSGATCVPVPLDLQSFDPASLRSSALGSYLDDLGGVVLCGGWNRTHRFDGTDTAEWEKTLRINFTGAIDVVSSIIAERDAPLAVVAIGSESCRIGDAGRAVYAAAKAAVASYLSELAAITPGLFAMTVAPGPIDTELMRSTYPSPAAADVGIAKLRKLVPLGRLGVPDDIAEAVAFAISDHGWSLNGQLLSVGGGITMQ